MKTCPFPHPPAIEPAALPDRIAKLPMLRGFPVPWFVARVDGEYDFRVMDYSKLVRAVKKDLCWVCGERLGAYKSFVIGPMCGINHTISEPPSHRECARYSARHCPFLSRPNMKRREDEMTRANEGNCAGIGLKRNPGACGVWTVKKFTLFKDHKGGVLFDIGEPIEVEWFCEGRAATRAEVQQSIDTGIHHLREACDLEETKNEQAAAHAELTRRISDFQRLLPTEGAQA